MRTLAVIVLGLGLVGCWYERARPAAPQAPVIPTSEATPRELPAAPDAAHDGESYRAATIAVDAVGVAALAAGGIGLLSGANTDVSGGLSVAGLLLAGYTVPIIHLAHRKGSRAGYSFLTRVIGSTIGSMTGVVSACPTETFALDCKFGGMMLGTAAGLAVASVIDAAFFHSDERPTESALTPTVSVTDGGARVGLAMPF